MTHSSPTGLLNISASSSAAPRPKAMPMPAPPKDACGWGGCAQPAGWQPHAGQQQGVWRMQERKTGALHRLFVMSAE